jgi:hypothetical protein
MLVNPITQLSHGPGNKPPACSHLDASSRIDRGLRDAINVMRPFWSPFPQVPSSELLLLNALASANSCCGSIVGHSEEGPKRPWGTRTHAIPIDNSLHTRKCPGTLQDHGQSEHCARRYRDPCENRKTGSFYQLERNGQRLMGRVRAAGFRQRDLRAAAGQHRRPAQGGPDFVFQGSGCRLGETGNPDRPQGHWHRSVWPVGYSNQHYGKAISTLFAN